MSISKDNSVYSCDGEKGLLNRIGRAGKNKLLIGLYSADLVDAAYQGLLGRQPDPEGFAVYKEELANSRNLAGIMKELAHSEEFRQKSIVGQAPEIVRAIYLALLGREPDEEGLASYAAQITDLDKIVSVFADIAHSEEFWQRIIAVHAQNLVKAAFLGLLGREPEPETAEAYSRELSEKGSLPAILADIVGSKEFAEKIGDSTTTEKRCGFRTEELVRQIFLGLLRREPDQGGLDSYTKLMQSQDGLQTVLSNVVESSEFAACYAKANSKVHPEASYNNPCLVFIHIEKTAGTSVQYHLHDCFSEDELYRENADNIWALSPSQLSKYKIFAGHFNYETLKYIPRKKLSIFTFVRKPKSRLQSLYYYYRAHELGNMFYSELVQLAGRVTIEEFFENDLIYKYPKGIWNNMYWAVMGMHDWRQWLQIVVKEKKESAIADVIESKIRPQVAKRLKEFTFIGLQEDFERSLLMLFNILKMPHPDKIRTDNSLEQIATKPHFKKVERQPVTERLDITLDRLVELDSIVYEEAEKLYKKRLSDFGF